MPQFRALLSNDSEMARRIREFDWAATPLGPPLSWPQSLRSALSICLNCNFPTAIYWGPELRLLYNDAWSSIPGPRHPAALGSPAREIWPDIWGILAPQFEQVITQGHGVVFSEQYLPMRRYGHLEETYWDYSFTPIAGEDGRVAGVFNQGQEVTSRIFGDRSNALLLKVGDCGRRAVAASDILREALGLLGDNIQPGTIAYGEVDTAAATIRIEGSASGGEAGRMPPRLRLDAFGTGLAAALASGEPFVVTDSRRAYRDAPDIQRQFARLGIGAMIAVPLHRDGENDALLFVHTPVPHHWSAGEMMLVRGFAARMWEELGRVRFETALRESERRHRLVFEQARDIIFTADLDQCITACNPAAAEAIGLPAEQIIGRCIAEFVSPEEFTRTSAMLKRKLSDGGVTRYEVAVRGSGGRTRQWDVNSALTIDNDGKPIGLHALARDITEKRAFDERQQLLINELNHRVKNTLALVQGLAMQSFKSDRSVIEGQDAFQARLAMLAAAHDLLTREYWEGATVAALVSDATAPYGGPEGRIVTRGPHVLLSPKAAISLVLALHELGTNAAKYGALSRPEGRVDLDWDLDPDRAFTLRWRESGGPPVNAPHNRGFGLRLLERVLANDLTGKVTLAFAPSGFDCTISATLSEVSLS